MQRQLGVTLIELMVTLSIAVILLAIAVPSFQTSIISNRLSGTSYEFLGALNYARSEAITRGVNVRMCKKHADPGTFTCVTGTDWSNGWIVYADQDNDSVLDDGETLRIGGALEGSYTAVSDNSANLLTYARNGTTADEGIFVFCHNSDEATALGVVVTRTRPRFAGDKDGDGIPEDNDGSDISSCESP